MNTQTTTTTTKDNSYKCCVRPSSCALCRTEEENYQYQIEKDYEMAYEAIENMKADMYDNEIDE